MTDFSKLLVALVLLLTPLAAYAQSTDMAHQSPLLSLSITGSARAKSDRTIISARFATKAPSASKAMAENARKISAMVKILKKAGESQKALATSEVLVYQEFTNKNGNHAPTPKPLALNARSWFRSLRAQDIPL